MKNFILVLLTTFSSLAFAEGPGPVIGQPLSPGQCTVACVPESKSGAGNVGLPGGSVGGSGGTTGGSCHMFCNPIHLPKVPDKKG